MVSWPEIAAKRSNPSMPREQDAKQRERRDRAIVRMYRDGIKLAVIASDCNLSERGVTRIVRNNGIKGRPNLRDKLGLKCWSLRESGLSQKAIAAKLGLTSEWSVKQLIRRTRRGLEAEIAGLEAENAKLRRLVAQKARRGA
jgi:transposase